jgi:hypothetical protein
MGLVDLFFGEEGKVGAGVVCHGGMLRMALILQDSINSREARIEGGKQRG